MKKLLKTIVIPVVLILSLFITNHAKSNIMEDTGLNQKEKSLVKISSYTAQGKIDELKNALNEGLDAGLTLNEINEELVQLYAYCGFPKSLNGITAFMEVSKTRKEKGISDEQGKEIVMNNNVEDKYEQGRRVLEELTKMPQSKPAPGFGEFSPRIDAFLKEHLFADIFASDVLSYHQRELITIAALASMPGAESQLGAHIFMGMNVGVTEKQLQDLFTVIESSVSEPAAENGRRMLQNMMNSRR